MGWTPVQTTEALQEDVIQLQTILILFSKLKVSSYCRQGEDIPKRSSE